jgi:hypothetical protein
MTDRKDFFISYNKADRQWAEWIAWTLEANSYSVVIQAWDFRPGGNFVLEMQKATAAAQKTIAVLSEDYLKAAYTYPEWAAAFAQDPQGEERKLLPVKVQECSPTGLLASIIWVDLEGLAEDQAREELLKGLQPSGRPSTPPQFPGSQGSTTTSKVPFPGESRTLGNPQ